jgi:hypothetical protein
MEIDKDDFPTLTLPEALGLIKDPVEDFRRKLKKYKFDFDSVDERGKTLLVNLVETMPGSDYIWVVLEYFADPNIKDSEYERTALHYACKAGNKGIILALLFFGAQIDVSDKEGKKPFEWCPQLKEELDQIAEVFEKHRVGFIQLTRGRRKYLKRIFDQIDQSTKFIDEGKLGQFNQTINDEPEEKAIEDARLFLEHSKLFKPDYESNKPSIIFEEFLFALVKIHQKHGLIVIDHLINRYKTCFRSKNNGEIN